MCTQIWYVRNSIHHPENTDTHNFTITQLRESIETLRKVITELT